MLFIFNLVIKSEGTAKSKERITMMVEQYFLQQARHIMGKVPHRVILLLTFVITINYIFLLVKSYLAIINYKL